MKTTLRALLRYVPVVAAAALLAGTAAFAGDSGEPISAPFSPLDPSTEEELAPTEAVTYEFMSIAATTLSPYNSSYSYDYSGAGCRYNDGPGTAYSDIDIQVPNGSIIDYLRVYYIDNDAVNDVDALLYEFDGGGSFRQIADARGSGTPGAGSAGSGLFHHMVDNANHSLVVRIANHGTDSSLAACRVRLRLQPAIFGDGFEIGSAVLWSSTVY